ncbi:MAG: N-acetylmuramoyl-L-alanine amidase [Sinomicrobium sp.]|nr:N-acetylmuramoyl-L-alanine amidase [Sinomicrobium sp.]
MLSKLLEAIKSLFSSLFGGSKSKDTPETKTPKPVEDEVLIPQDGSEITPDTVVVIANEMDSIEIIPDAPDSGFDDDIFAEPEKEDTSSPPEVVVTPPVEKPEEKPQQPEAPKGRYLWCLDNGHGKKTPGKRSPLFDDRKTQLFEYEFNRDVVKRIAKGLDEHKISYFVVVPEVDIDDFLEGRVNRANDFKTDLPKLFVSVHSNAAPARSSNDWAAESISGIETWHFHNSNRGQKMASIFQKHLLEKTKFKNRHLKSRPEGQFYVLRKTKMTAVLTENGFYNNKSEATNLMKDEVRQQVADAHIAAILEIEKNGL